jgi:ribonuclease HI
MAKLKGIVTTDGSFNPASGSMGMAAILECGDKSITIVFGRQCRGNQAHGANIAELRMAKTAIKAARAHGITRLVVRHDWNGVEWFSHPGNISQRHKSCPYYSQYAEYVERSRHNMRICFEKVTAHAGDKRNTQVDSMARQAASEPCK